MQDRSDLDRNRWSTVAIVAVILAVVMGQLVNGLSSFFTPLEAEFGWARADIALINTAGLVGLAIGGVCMGLLADRFGTRRIATLGILVSAGCFMVASQATALWQVYAIFLIAGCLGGGAVFGPLIALVGRWFTTGAGLALGLVAAGQAIGQGAVPFVNVMLIEAFGWRAAFLAYGFATVVVVLPLVMMLKAPPRQTVAASVQDVGAKLPSVLAVGMMSTAVFWCCTLMSVPLMHLLPLMESCGIPAPQAGAAVFVMMAAAIAGRVAFGRIADLVGPVQAWFIASLWQTSLVFVFVGIDSLALFLLFAPIYGFGYAGVMTSVLASLKALMPVATRSTTTGIVMAFGWLGHGFGGYAGGALFDANLDYTAAFGFAALAGVVNLVIIGALWRAISSPRSQVAVA